jgi:hypothetical protein
MSVRLFKVALTHRGRTTLDGRLVECRPSTLAP